jgi:hypothetical protein
MPRRRPRRTYLSKSRRDEALLKHPQPKQQDNAMPNKTYNGWSNYETWNVKLWLDNDEGTQEYWHERVREIARTSIARYPGQSLRDSAIADLSEELKAEHEQLAPDLGATVWSDLLGAAMSEVNWREIAKSYLDDLTSDEWGEDDDA